MLPNKSLLRLMFTSHGSRRDASKTVIQRGNSIDN